MLGVLNLLIRHFNQSPQVVLFISSLSLMHRGGNNSFEGGNDAITKIYQTSQWTLPRSGWLIRIPSLVLAQTSSPITSSMTRLRPPFSWQHSTPHAPGEKPFFWDYLHLTHCALNVSVSPAGFKQHRLETGSYFSIYQLCPTLSMADHNRYVINFC